VGKHVPPANDGSNYYAARQYNTAQDFIYEDNVGGTYARQNSSYMQLTSFTDTFVGADINSNSNWQPIPITFVAAPKYGKSVWSHSGTIEFTLEASINEPISWISGDGRPLTLEEQAALQEQYTRVPDHPYRENFWGQCEDCPSHNLYRREMNAHLFVIEEETDWLRELAS